MGEFKGDVDLQGQAIEEIIKNQRFLLKDIKTESQKTIDEHLRDYKGTEV